MADARPDCPVLTSGSRVVKQTEEGEVRWIVRAGGTGKYLRVGKREAIMIELVDGVRTVQEISTGFTARAKEPVTAQDVAGFVARMRKLAVIEETAEMKNLLLVEKVRQRRTERHFSGKFGAILFWRIPLVNPDAFLVILERRTRWIFTRWFLALCAAIVFAATVVLITHRDEVFGRIRDFGAITSGAGLTLGAAWATALTVVAFHELAHGVACKHWGGDVHEMGFLLLFFQPCFYCNVNDAWTFESRAQRLWVTAAGGFVELILGSTCVLIWVATDPGTLVHGVCYLVFMISLSSTLLFNMNPLIKLDGYYLLADFLRIENLRERSLKQLSYLFKGKLLRQPAASPAKNPKEAFLLSAYGISSTAYMGLLLLVIASVLFGGLGGEDGPGPMLTMFFLMLGWIILRPAVKAMGGAMKQATATQLKKHGSRGVLLRCGAGAGIVLVVGILTPWTRTTGAEAPAEPRTTAEIRFPLSGRIAEVLVAEGTIVKAGDPLLRIDSPVEAVHASMERETASRLRREALRQHAAGDASSAATLEEKAEAARMRAEDLERRIPEADLPSPLDGTVLTRRVKELTGTPISRNDTLLKVGDLKRVRFRALLGPREAGPVREGMEATVHFRDRPGEPLHGTVVAVSNSPVDPESEPRAKGLTGPHWEVVVEAENPDRRVLPGMRGEVQVILGRTSLAGAFARGVMDAFRPDLLR